MRQLIIKRCVFLAALILTCVFSTSANTADSESCIACHGNKDFTTTRKGRTISLFVNQGDFSRSAHSSVGCVGCHPDAQVAEPPHKPGLAAVDCAGCHKAEKEHYDASIHGQAMRRGTQYAPGCIDCHGKHDILKSSNPLSQTFKMNIPLLCGKCHKEDAPVARLFDIPQKNIIENYKESIHGEGLLKKGLLVAASCNDCHASHEILPHTDAKSTINASNIAKTCSKCHVMIEQVHKKTIKGEVWERKPGAIPACTDCHSPHTIRKGALVIGMADRDCLKCHETEKPIVHREDVTSSAHNKIPCVKCHSDVSPEHQRPCDTSGKVDCSGCHAQQAENYTSSIHGKLKQEKNDPDVPYCTDCHGTHKVISRLDDRSPTFRLNIPNLCAKCHREGEKAAVRYKGDQGDILKSYQMSTHGKGLLESGLISSATCIDCHTSHNELPKSDPRSSVNPANLPATCARCHRGIYDQFSKSVHSPGQTKTNQKLPVCEDCHTAHNIARVDKDKFMQEVSSQCGDCHKDVAATYFQTYHGKAYQLGYLKAAKCSDCHGAHDILKPSNPDSHLSRNKVIETCKKCHPGSNRKFTGYLTHATHHNRYKYPVLFYTFWGMTLLLVGTFIFFGIHTILWLPKSFARFKEKREMHVAEETVQFVRFKLSERVLHFSVIISFFGLAITGMMLKFANMTWASTLSDLIGGVRNAGAIHRLCAVITFGYFSAHIYMLLRHKKEKQLTFRGLIFNKNSLVPNLQDLREFLGTMKWFFGLGERPHYGRWTYWEKFDYFAVFWGVAIIGSTGLVLWFPEFFTMIFPGWLINVATIIHSDEALLAVGFIFTIHFFNTHLRPESFPMDPVIFTGRVPLSELKHDRPAEYKEVISDIEFEKNLVKPIERQWFKPMYAFGLTCLVVGIVLTVLIIYSMLFGYK